MQQLRQRDDKGLDALHKVVLVVEDDEAIGAMLVEALAREMAYQVVLVGDAFQAMRVMDNLRPNLLITDYRLPQVNGIELYDRLAAMKKLVHMPTILMSAHLPEDEVKKRHLVGLHKPFELDELLDTVEKLLEA